MKKTVFLTALGLLGMLSASAKQHNYSEGGLGVRVQWDYSIPSTNLEWYDNGSGVSAGIFYDVALGHSLFLEPGVSFYYDTFTIDGLPVAVDKKDVLSSGTWRNTGLRVPLYLGYRFNIVDDISMSVITGPQVNLGIHLSERYNGLKFSDLYDHGWHRWDIQWMAGLKFHYLDNFFAEIIGGVGINNISEVKGSHVRRNMFAIGVGYIF